MDLKSKIFRELSQIVKLNGDDARVVAVASLVEDGTRRVVREARRQVEVTVLVEVSRDHASDSRKPQPGRFYGEVREGALAAMITELLG